MQFKKKRKAKVQDEHMLTEAWNDLRPGPPRWLLCAQTSQVGDTMEDCVAVI